MIISTKQSGTTADGRLEVGNYHASDNYISIWQDSDLVIVYVDQVEALIAELQKFKENA